MARASIAPIVGHYVHARAVRGLPDLFRRRRTGHLPDQAWHDPERFKTAAFWTLRELKLLRGTLENTDERGALFRLSTDADQKAFANDMVDAIVKGYQASIRSKTAVGMAILPSELSEQDGQRFTKELEKTQNASTLRRHPTFEIPVPGYTKVEYNRRGFADEIETKPRYSCANRPAA